MRLAAIQGTLPGQGSKPPAPVESSPDDRVLANLASGGRTVAELRRDLGVADEVLREALARLEARGLVVPSIRGKTTKYQLKEDPNNA